MVSQNKKIKKSPKNTGSALTPGGKNKNVVPKGNKTPKTPLTPVGIKNTTTPNKSKLQAQIEDLIKKPAKENTPAKNGSPVASKKSLATPKSAVANQQKTPQLLKSAQKGKQQQVAKQGSNKKPLAAVKPTPVKKLPPTKKPVQSEEEDDSDEDEDIDMDDMDSLDIDELEDMSDLEDEEDEDDESDSEEEDEKQVKAKKPSKQSAAALKAQPEEEDSDDDVDLDEEYESDDEEDEEESSDEEVSVKPLSVKQAKKQQQPKQEPEDEEESEEEEDEDNDEEEEEEEEQKPKKGNKTTPSKKEIKQGLKRQWEEELEGKLVKKQKVDLAIEVADKAMEDSNRRTLFIRKIPVATTEEELKKLSSEIISVRFPSKGKLHVAKTKFAFVEFKNEATAEKQLQLLQKKSVGGNQLQVDYCGSKSEYYKNRTSEQKALFNPQKLFVSNIPSNATEADLKEKFPFATIVSLIKHGKELAAYLTFVSPESAAQALKSVAGLKIKGQPVLVMYAKLNKKKNAKRKKIVQENEDDSE